MLRFLLLAMIFPFVVPCRCECKGSEPEPVPEPDCKPPLPTYDKYTEPNRLCFEEIPTWQQLSAVLRHDQQTSFVIDKGVITDARGFKQVVSNFRFNRNYWRYCIDVEYKKQ